MRKNGILRLNTIIACFCLIFGISFLNFDKAWAEDNDVKTEAYALYNTNNINEALKLLENLPLEQKDEEVFVLIANIYEDKLDLNKAVENLNKALVINPEYFKAYYNLGCIFLNKKAYELAEKNLLLAINSGVNVVYVEANGQKVKEIGNGVVDLKYYLNKYNKDFAYSYYNLGTLYLRTGKYEKAKKNLIKAIYLKGDEKDFYINLAYAYKFLGKEKESKKLLEIYNNSSK